MAVVGFGLFAYAFLQANDNTFPVWIENDGATPVVLKQCDPHCKRFMDQADLVAGQRVAENTVVDIPNWWQVNDQAGHTLGCLPLLFGRRHDNAVVRTSQTQDCPQ